MIFCSCHFYISKTYQQITSKTAYKPYSTTEPPGTIVQVSWAENKLER